MKSITSEDAVAGRATGLRLVGKLIDAKWTTPKHAALFAQYRTKAGKT